MELEIFNKMLASGGNGSLMLFGLYIGWQVKGHLKHLESSLDSIRESVTNLSTSVNRLIADNDHGKVEIERIRDDIKQLWEKINVKS